MLNSMLNSTQHCPHATCQTAGLGGSAAVCAVYPFHENSKTVLLMLVGLLGTLNSIAFSTSYQIVTHFAISNSVALTTGGLSCHSMNHTHFVGHSRQDQ